MDGKKNPDVRKAIEAAGLRYWQVAQALEVHEGNFCRLLRRELDDAIKAKILLIIEELKKEAL